MIIINYGIPKSASTYLWMLCRDLIYQFHKLNGYRIIKISDIIESSPYADFFDPNIFNISIDEFYRKVNASLSSNDIIQIKIHHHHTHAISQLLHKHGGVATISFRHPAECILSLLDAYKIYPKRFKNGENFQSAFKAIMNSVRICSKWINKNDLTKMSAYYDNFVANPYSYLYIFSKLICFDVAHKDIDKIVNKYENNKSLILEYNKGIVNRMNYELTSEQIEIIEYNSTDLIKYISFFKN